MLPLIDLGQGETTLVMMYFFGNSHREWLDVIPHLSADYRCIALDMPGFGDAVAVEGYGVTAMTYQVA